MSEEGKKAIEVLKKMCIEVLRDDNLISYDEYSPLEKMTLVDIVLNLIEKQQKELEQEKEKNKELENADLTSVYMSGFYDGEKKWKDKIKAEIKEIKNTCYYNEGDATAVEQVFILEKLLGE